MAKLELPLQGTLKLGGRGSDRIEQVKKHDADTWLFMIDTREGPRQAMKLDMSSNTLYFYGDTRVHAYARIELSKTGAKKLRREVKKAYEVQK